MSTDLALLVFVKYPEPGKVKTRLAKSLGYERAAELYREFVTLTLQNCEQLAQAAHFATFTPPERKADLLAMFPGEWHWFEQHAASDLGMRIQYAFETLFKLGYRRVLTIGTDSPSLPLAYLEEAAEKLLEYDVVLGPAEDGGYYLIGLKVAPRELFEGIAWSTEKVLTQTLGIIQRLGLSVHLLPQWYDVDDVAALEKLSAVLPKVKRFFTI
ncbi:TIGR04282 family arsenosugar biosynthesis glycosyltransferase [candidate division KSB1 bacterium]|nr:TIGR04282 family arsenosugar biosynthesis glycosyltransferase [candidate division KSB1 bacterium]